MPIISTFIGRLGSDPETRTVGQTTVCNFRVAVDHGYGDKKTTTWLRVAAWGKRGEFVQRFFTKGKQIFLSGETWTSEYNDKLYLEMDATVVEFAGSKSDGDSQQRDQRSTGNSQQPTGAGGTYADDSIPF